MDTAAPDDQAGTPRKKRCGAKLRKKPGKRCQIDKVMANGRCRLHGGKSLSGPNSRTWKHGQRSKHRWLASLPGDTLGKRFDAALADPTMTSLRHAIALNDALITSYTSSLKDTGKPLTLKQQDRVHKLLAMQANLAEREARRQRDLAVLITQAQFTAFTNAVLAAVRDNVPDVKALLDIQRRVQTALLTGPAADTVIDIEGGSE